MKGNIMSVKMIGHKANGLPPRTDADRARLAALAARPDSEIDLSDIPELTEENWTNAVRGKHYRPVKARRSPPVSTRTCSPGSNLKVVAIKRA